jgi:hypothetical protein
MCLCHHGRVEALIGIVGALIGAAGAFAATLIASQRQRASEYKKEVRLAVAELTRVLGSAGHSINWLTWKARFTPSEFGEQAIHDYNTEMHRELPKILGSLAVVSALDADAWQKVRPLANDLLMLDAKVASAAAGFYTDRAKSVEAVGMHTNAANAFISNLNVRTADILVEI